MYSRVCPLPACAIRAAASNHMSVDALVSELKASMLFKESTVAVLREVWKTEGPSLCDLPKKALSVGQVRVAVTPTLLRCGWLSCVADLNGLETGSCNELQFMPLSLFTLRHSQTKSC